MTTRPRLLLQALILLFLLVGSIGVADSVGAISPNQYRPDGQECAFLRKINQYRDSNGAGRLKISKTLGAAAEHHSRDMAAKNYFSHDFRGGPTWEQNIRNHGYTGNWISENIAVGTSMDTASEAFNVWKTSREGHNENMLDRKWKAIGIGRAFGDFGQGTGWYWTTTFGDTVDSVVRC